MRADKRWSRIFLKRFADREDIGKENLYKDYFKPQGLPLDDVLECLELIAMEYEISIGLLRPSDSLQILFEPISPANPWQWMLYQIREGDSQSEINYELTKRMRKYGTLDSWHKIETVEELIYAWCGQKPENATNYIEN